MKMTISNVGLNLIKSFEGCGLKAYRDSVGILTIGFGETGTFTLTGQKITEGMKITQDQAEKSFVMTLENKGYINAVNKLNISMNQNIFDALVSFCYNLGTGIFTGTLLSSIKAKKWDDVARQMKLYNKARVNGVLTELKGLTRRRNAEAELLLKEVVTSSQEDKELADAVSKIIRGNINIDFNSWKRVSLIKLNNVPALLTKMGGIDKLVKDKVIGDKQLWISGKYNVNHVRSLIIKYSKTI